MKKIFTTIVAGLMISAQVLAVSVKDVCGQFDGDLWIDWDEYPNRSVYLLPGAVENTLTFVLPDFTFGNGKLGDIVLPNIQMDANGKLTLDEATIWLDSISLRASAKMLNNYEDEEEIYNSIVSATEAQVTLEIAEPTTLPVPIIVVFEGNAVRSNNYALNNGGFEGEWTNNEPQGWHSFGSACGVLVDFVKNNTFQFVQSDEVRPGSAGAHSALLSSNMLLGVKANGNCTNGRINAGSMDAKDATGNYSFSDPDSTGFNTPLNGRPDSIVFWAKYLPANRELANDSNKARINAVITTNARYQDPESASFAEAKIGAAALNYSAVDGFGWQRLSVPFAYEAEKADAAPAYILTTFSTNQIPGGGTSYSTSGKNKQTVLDSVYVDDVELVYNKQLSTFKLDDAALQFDQYIASVESNYCDSCADYIATGDGITAQTFIAFDATHKCIFIYVIADDYAQSGAYSLYRVDFTDSDTSDLNPMEAIEFVNSQNTPFEKVIINGQLFIRSGEVWFNATGARVK